MQPRIYTMPDQPMSLRPGPRAQEGPAPRRCFWIKERKKKLGDKKEKKRKREEKKGKKRKGRWKKLFLGQTNWQKDSHVGQWRGFEGPWGPRTPDWAQGPAGAWSGLGLRSKKTFWSISQILVVKTDEKCQKSRALFFHDKYIKSYSQVMSPAQVRVGPGNGYRVPAAVSQDSRISRYCHFHICVPTWFQILFQIIHAGAGLTP